MNANIWIALGLVALVFSAYAIPHGFSLKSQGKNVNTQGEPKPPVIQMKDSTVGGDVVGRDKITYDQRKITLAEKPGEIGTWSPSIQYATNKAKKGSARIISVDEAIYELYPKKVKVKFDFRVDLTQVPSGSTLAIGGLPVVVQNANVYDFKVYQTGLNCADLVILANRHAVWLYLATMQKGVQKYITNNTENSVRLWGYILYKHEDNES